MRVRVPPDFSAFTLKPAILRVREKALAKMWLTEMCPAGLAGGALRFYALTKKQKASLP